MSSGIWAEADLVQLINDAARRLGLAIEAEVRDPKIAMSEHLSISAIRSKQGQVVTYPITRHEYHRGRLITLPLTERFNAAVKMQEKVIEELKIRGIFGPAVFQFNLSGDHLKTQEGVTSDSLWSETFALTSFFENAVREAYGLPFGSSQMTESDWLVARFDAPLSLDMTHPYLHLFAHEPRYRICKLTSHSGYVALSGTSNLKEKVIHAVDYLEGVINE